MSYSGLSTVTIAEQGWRNKIDVRVSSISCNWRVNGAGRFSAIISARDAHLMGVSEWKGLWVYWEHPAMGVWGGVIIANPSDAGRGTMEFSAISMHHLLSGRVTARTYEQQTAPAGALALRAVTDANNDRDLWITSAVADEGGPLYRLTWKGDDLLRVVDSLARQGSHEYDVTVSSAWEIAFAFRRMIGSDKTGRVVLVDGYQAFGEQTRPSIEGLVNQIVAVSSDQDWERAHSAIVSDRDSADQYGGIYQQTRRYPLVTSRAGLTTAAMADLEVSAQPVIPISIQLPDTHVDLADIAQGDTVRVWSAAQNRIYDVRVIHRAVDVDRASATLTGDAVEAS